jgi:predicted transcriptional regulator YdeE
MPGAKLVHAGTPEFEVYDWRFSMEEPEKSEVEIFVPVG